MKAQARVTERGPAARKPSGGSGTRVGKSKVRSTKTGKHATASSSVVRAKVGRLVEELGNNRVADLLSVSRSQPSRWRSRAEGITPENQRGIVDLEYALTRLHQLYPPELATTWLTSHNAHLGARPVDVLRTRGALPVVAAIDAEAEGAYA